MSIEAELQRRAAEARDAIQGRKFFQPQVALILGSGLGEMANSVEHAWSIPYADIPHFPKTHAVGHAGRLVLGYLSGLPVVVMQGRAHRYEGCSNLDVSFPVYCMHALGADKLIATNAAGGLNTRFQTGDSMVIDSHIHMLWQRDRLDLQPTFTETGQSVRGPSPYDFDLLADAQAVARRQDIVLHQGCYLATLGPTYETRAEYKMFRMLGADAVGMSTAPEVIAARRLGMRVLAFSVITNVASTDIPQSTTHAEVVDSGNSAGPKLIRIIQGVLEDLAGQPD